MANNVNIALKIIDFFDKKYGKPIGIVVFVKCISVISVKNEHLIPLSILNISHSQSFKTQSSFEVRNMFKRYIANFHSDFTIHCKNCGSLNFYGDEILG